MARERTLRANVAKIEHVIIANQNKPLMTDMEPYEMLELHKEQMELGLLVQWLLNILNNEFPPKIIAQNGPGVIKKLN